MTDKLDNDLEKALLDAMGTVSFVTDPPSRQLATVLRVMAEHGRCPVCLRPASPHAAIVRRGRPDELAISVEFSELHSASIRHVYAIAAIRSMLQQMEEAAASHDPEMRAFLLGSQKLYLTLSSEKPA